MFGIGKFLKKVFRSRNYARRDYNQIKKIKRARHIIRMLSATQITYKRERRLHYGEWSRETKSNADQAIHHNRVAITAALNTYHFQIESEHYHNVKDSNVNTYSRMREKIDVIVDDTKPIFLNGW